MTNYRKLSNEEIAAHVATRIMKWRWSGWSDDWDDWEECLDGRWLQVPWEDWDPARRGDHVLRVISEIGRRGWDITIKRRAATWLVEIPLHGDEGEPSIIWHGRGDSMPRAVCEAVLSAADGMAERKREAQARLDALLGGGRND
jgi:hypothetical protein